MSDEKMPPAQPALAVIALKARIYDLSRVQANAQREIDEATRKLTALEKQIAAAADPPPPDGSLMVDGVPAPLLFSGTPAQR